MNRPKMVIFDAGRTLIDYTDIDLLKGVRALMPYITENPRKLSAEQLNDFTNSIFDRFEAARKQLWEVHVQTILKLVYDTLGIRFSIPLSQVERIIWTETSTIEAIPHAGETLQMLKEMGIPTAVISNLDFSGYLLKERLDSLFPGNQFRFVIASSDYGIRKPNPLLFQVGIAKSGLNPGDIWYVGDKIPVDAEGSKHAGMIPILYRNGRNAYGTIPADLTFVNDLPDIVKLIDKFQ